MANRRIQKAALVTGAGQRIGRAVTLKLAEEGYTVAVHYNRSRAEADSLVSQIKSRGHKAQAFQCNLFDSSAAASLIKNVRKKFPGLSLLVNNASIFEESDLRRSSAQSLDRNLAVHLKAPYILTQSLARHCRNGSVINILDTHITDSRTAHFDYLLSKKALAEFTQMAAVALAPRVRVNAIAPGLILPPAKKKKDYLNRLAKRIPLKRKGDLDNIVQSVNFLAKNDYVTGQVLFVDGGEHLI